MNRSFITVFVAFWIVAYMLISLLQEVKEAWKWRVAAGKFHYKSILNGDLVINYPILLASLLDGWSTEKFKLKWQECVETIYAYYTSRKRSSSILENYQL